MAAGTAMPPQWVKYWLTHIAWGRPGDFNECVVKIQAKIVENGRKPLPDREIKGLCATLHKMATGARPGHAPGESGGKG